MDRGDQSTFCMATIPLAPWVTDFNYDAIKDSWDKGQRTKKMLHLNHKIIEMNLRMDQLPQVAFTPRFHVWGFKASQAKKIWENPNKVLTKYAGPRQQYWREETKAIHLTNEVCLRMGLSIIKHV